MDWWVNALAVAELFIVPMIVFLMQRGLSHKLDAFDKKRDDARIEREQESRKNDKRQNDMERGIRSLLRAELIHEHRKWMERGYCTLESKEYVKHTYDAYHGLGGNDIGTNMYNDLMALPTNEGLER